MVVYLASGAFALVVVLGIAALTFGVPHFVLRRANNRSEIDTRLSRVRWRRLLIFVPVIAIVCGLYVGLKPYLEPVGSIAGHYANPGSALRPRSGTSSTSLPNDLNVNDAFASATSALGGATGSGGAGIPQSSAQDANNDSFALAASALGGTATLSGANTSPSGHLVSLTQLVYGLGALVLITSVLKRLVWGLIFFRDN